MSLQSAMQAGVAGLTSQSRRLATISDNIANSQTVGYKRSIANFTSQVMETASRTAYLAGGVDTMIRHEIERTGAITSSGRSTDLAIDGNGFFLVKAGNPATQIGEDTLLTRVGSASLDAGGYLRLDNGYYLQGVALDDNGIPETLLPSAIRLDKLPLAPTPTDTVTFTANLPSQLAQAPGGEPLTTVVSYVDQLGATRSLHFKWTPMPGDPAVENRWTLEIYDVETDADNPVYTGDIDFDPGTGQLIGIPLNNPQDLDDIAGDNIVAINGVNNMPLQIQLNLTQFDYTYAPVFSNDGITAADFSGVEVGEDGTVYSVFKNGQREANFRLVMGDVANPAGLKPVAGNAYAATLESGDLLQRFADAGTVGPIRAYAIEGSNVDIAEELTTMITTQRAYSANASTVTTSDQMLEEVIRLKR